MVSQEGSLGVDGGVVPIVAAMARKRRPQPQSQPKQNVKRNRRKILLDEEMEE